MTDNTETPVRSLPFLDASDSELQKILSDYQISLTVDEARTVSKLLGRDPTVPEAVIWGIQGSEHCSYKSSRRFLSAFLTEGKHIILGPKEDSGIVAITDGPKGKRWGLAIAHESHNHPSQIVPFEGAATGVGGVVRDVLCMGARVVGCMDLLRLGDLKTEESRAIATEVVRGIGGYGNPLGVANLGGDTVFDASYNTNCLVNAVAVGIVREDEIIHSYVPDEAGSVGYDIILVGKPTDRSGFGGAAFASVSMEEEKKEQNASAVQEPNPFLERHLLASTYALFDWLAAEKKLDKVSYKDLGAGGVVCASVEQVSDLGFGAEVNLDSVHTALPGLPPEVIGCSETQERLCWICHPDLTDHIVLHYNDDWDLPSVAENARASVVGKVTSDGIYRLRHKGEIVCEAKSVDITSGLLYERPTKEIVKEHYEPEIECQNAMIVVYSPSQREGVRGRGSDRNNNSDISRPPHPAPLPPGEGDSPTYKTSITDLFKTMLAHPNHCSKRSITVHFDKNVIGNTVIEAGEADASVIAPLQDLQSHVHKGTHPGWEELSEEDRWRGVVLAGDGNGRYGRISPYLQGLNAAVESMRNVAAVGAVPRALTDCLNYGNPEIAEQLFELSEGIRGIADAAKGVVVEGEPVPVISGNVSLYNGKPDGSSIDPTAIVCTVGVISDARKAVSMQLTSPSSDLYLIGQRKDECGGSAYYEVLEQMSNSDHDALLGKNVPHPDLATVSAEIECVTRAIDQELIRSCHDVSTGGLLLALFEMTTPKRKQGGGIGIDVDVSSLAGDLRNDQILFSETGGFVLEVDPKNAEKLMQCTSDLGVSIHKIGSTTHNVSLTVKNDQQTLFSESTADLHAIWESALKRYL